MTSLLLGLSLLLLSCNGGQSFLTSDQEWEEWKTKYGKSYASIDEEAYRRRLWTKHVEQVTAHNKAFARGEESYEQAVYRWADQNRSQAQDNNSKKAKPPLFNWTVNTSSAVWSSASVDESIDYRLRGRVTVVDDQGECDACWAFTATGAIEGLMGKTMPGSMVKLSAQQILDCEEIGYGNCDGGNPADAMSYARDKGLQPDCNYQYTAQVEACRYDPTQVVFTFKNFICIEHMDEIMLKRYIASEGPGITHIVSTDSFDNYQGGLYSTDECQPDMDADHSILIVGYGTTEQGEDYWLIKNSHGAGWGDGGYMKFQRNVGLCKIGTYNVWPGA